MSEFWLCSLQVKLLSLPFKWVIGSFPESNPPSKCLAFRFTCFSISPNPQSHHPQKVTIPNMYKLFNPIILHEIIFSLLESSSIHFCSPNAFVTPNLLSDQWPLLPIWRCKSLYTCIHSGMSLFRWKVNIAFPLYI